MTERQPVALLTGASRGFGLAVSHALAVEGWALVIDARSASALEAAAGQLAALTRVVAVPGDVTDPRHRAELFAAVEDMDGLDLLVNNASMLGPSPQPNLSDYPLEVLTRVYEVNVIGPLAMIQLALPRLRERRGVIVNVTSDVAVEAYPGWGGYGSSKAALSQVSHVLSTEEPDVTIYWFDPGDMNTTMHQEAFPGEDISDRPPPEDSVPALLDLIRLGRPSGWYQARTPVSTA